LERANAEDRHFAPAQIRFRGLKLNNKKLVEKLTRSEIYRDYARAFSNATGLPVALRPVEHWQLAMHEKQNENPFCVLMARSSRICAACLEVQRKLTEHAGDRTRTVTCFAGLSDSAVPIRVGDQLIGFLQTGQILLNQPSKFRFDRTARTLVNWGVKIDLTKAREAYFHTRVLSTKQYRGMLRLLEIFGRHLSILSNQIAVESSAPDPAAVAKAKHFIAQNQDNALCLATVAKAVNTSTFYFCKLFKRATGLTFTDYLSRVRVEKAKTLLGDPNRRVSEVAYDVGFQSLTHFNRVFHKITGQSPTNYRRSARKSA
jgi:AraC-like DNA-binding protein/ligand-binding sensor protein